MTDRVIVYAGSIPLETDVLRSNKFAMIGIAKLAAAMLGTSTIVNGLACVPTGPASLTVNVNPGEIYSLVSIDATAYSSVAADTTHQIMKSGILLDAVNLSCPAPGTAGQSINYLVQVIYQDSDTDLTALPYYNAANPTQAWSGPNNTGTPQATTRKGIITISAKAGAAAATGSQTTPTPDAGYTGLWVVTVANGQTQILAGNITQYAGAPILPSSLLASIQTGNLSYAVATGTANAHAVALTPALTQRVDGMVIRYKAPAANTGALTLNDGLGAVSVVGGAHAALQGGETVTNGDVWVQWNSSVGGGSYVMLDSSGAALQVAPATQSQHALQLGQATGRLLRTSIYAIVSGSQQVSINGGAYTATGATTFNPQALTNAVDVETIGGGGAGGGAGATGSGQGSGGAPGSGGGYARKRLTSGFSGITVTVGAGGTPGAAGANPGGNGGTSSFGAAVSATGGLGGPGQAATSGFPAYAGPGTAGVGSGGDINAGGFVGTVTLIGGALTGQGSAGSGGGSVTGGGAIGPAFGTNGNPTTTPGAAGSGCVNLQNGSALQGGAGMSGLVIVREYQ